MSQGNRFGSLSAGMIVRGSVPPQVLFGPGAAIPAAAPPPVASAPVVVAPVVVAAVPPAKPAAVAAMRKTVTFRVEPAQHLRLRVACAVQGRSAQAVLVEALTDYLDGLACCEAASP